MQSKLNDSIEKQGWGLETPPLIKAAQVTSAPPVRSFVRISQRRRLVLWRLLTLCTAR